MTSLLHSRTLLELYLHSQYLTSVACLHQKLDKIFVHTEIHIIFVELQKSLKENVNLVAVSIPISYGKWFLLSSQLAQPDVVPLRLSKSLNKVLRTILHCYIMWYKVVLFVFCLWIFCRGSHTQWVIITENMLLLFKVNYTSDT